MWFAGSQAGLPVGAAALLRRTERFAVPRSLRVPFFLAIPMVLAIAATSAPAMGQAHNPAQPGDPSPFGNAASESSAATTGVVSTMDALAMEGLPLSIPPVGTTWLLAAESCNSWTEWSSHSPTVSVARLAVPGKASSEYQKGCGALKDKKLSEAEEHERSAIRLYPGYAAALVVLGQVLEAEHKREDGRTACSQARSVDPDYVAPYLCLADFAAGEDNWKEVSILSGSALTIDPSGNAYSFYYAADAAYHLGNLEKALKDAQNSITLDKWRHLAQVHLLMAQIYKAKQDWNGQATQLREYLKMAPNAPEASGARLALLELAARAPLPLASSSQTKP